MNNPEPMMQNFKDLQKSKTKMKFSQVTCFQD